ncbi:MAG TPA: hypothetical protein PLK30_21065 [Blastocatellia bacterium]|nr:hypothetical protein [Blastocatellia bacterium]
MTATVKAITQLSNFLKSNLDARHKSIALENHSAKPQLIRELMLPDLVFFQRCRRFETAAFGG